MSDIEVENYKRSLTTVVERWGAEMDRLGKKLSAVEAELAKLEAIKTPSDAEKKRIADLQKQREQIRKEVNNANMSLKINLMVITPPPRADEKELMKLPGWLKEIIEHKGIPLGSGVSIAPDVSFDFKAKKLKSVGVTIRW